MIKVALNGARGNMCRYFASLVQEQKDILVIAGVDPASGSDTGFPIYRSLDEMTERPDAILDFSIPEGVEKLCRYGVDHGISLIVGTTGLEESHYSLLKAAGEHIPVYNTYNMHIGVWCFLDLIRSATEYLKDWDIEIVEQHHRSKLDAPSGTAVAISKIIGEIIPDARFVYDRTKEREKRRKNDVGVSCIRCGSMVGEHTIIYGGEEESIELHHVVVSRKVLGAGAITALRWLMAQKPGYYTSPDLVRSMKIRDARANTK
jgi:4-hydroxy-tetrahydrodipicolinate reductase